MGGATLPPGFRFHPTDEELVGYYLKRKVEGLEIELEVIPVIELYKFDPWELPEKSFLPKRDMEWFFFCPRDRKYPNGSRTNRATKAGYWKATGKDRKVTCKSAVVGHRKTLVFYRGRAPLGDRTNWVMHEYRLCDDHFQGSPSFQGGFALCRVVKRNEQAQKSCHGEAEAKNVGGSSSNGNFGSTRLVSNEPLSISADISSHPNNLINKSGYSSLITSPYEVTPMGQHESVLTESNPSKMWISPDFILDSSKDYPKVQESMSACFPQYEFPSSTAQWHTYEYTEISPSSSYSNLPGEIEVAEDFSQFGGCIPPYSEQPNYMNYW